MRTIEHVRVTCDGCGATQKTGDDGWREARVSGLVGELDLCRSCVQKVIKGHPTYHAAGHLVLPVRIVGAEAP